MSIFRFKNRSLLLFHIVFAAVVVANFPNQYFIGWDALSPELNFWVNLQRSFYGFWQENYGVGLLGGHGFSAMLPHTLIAGFLSIILPQWAVRSTFTFLCLYAGSLGMYFLARAVILASGTRPGSDSGQARMTIISTEYFALMSALFYMLNLGTIQIFYVQLEAFIVQYATLPWLFYLILKLLKTKTSGANVILASGTRPGSDSGQARMTLLAFFLISFVSTVQGFIPSLVMSYFVALFLFLLVYCIHNRIRRESLKNAAFILVSTGLIHLYYALPLIYFQLTRSNGYLNSYNNLISTQHFIDVNKKYGDLYNVALLKSYLLDLYELGHHILEPWILHFNGFVQFLGLVFFSFSLVGLFSAIFKKTHWLIQAFVCIYLFFFISMVTSTPPFSFATDLLSFISPTFHQAFRTTFTKFGIGLSFSYSLFLGIGLLFVFEKLRNKVSFNKQKLLFIAVLAALLWYGFPIFRGYLIFRQLKTDIPKAYQDIFTYFKNEPDGRIADFPQDCSEGWSAYSWGYFGSGFYWYAVKQPFLARTFDVWSNYNENYYWEVSQALREENYYKVDNLLQKYDVKWIIYDPNSIYCRNQKGFLLNEQLVDHLAASSRYILVKTFQSEGVLPVRIYKNMVNTSKSFVSVARNIPAVSPTYAWNDNDYGYYLLGLYKTVTDSMFDVYYPFRALFTKRNDKQNDFQIRVDKDSLTLEAPIPFDVAGGVLRIKGYASIEKSVPVHIHIQSAGVNTYDALATLDFPILSLGKTVLTKDTPELFLGRFSTNNIDTVKILVNGDEIGHDPFGNYYTSFYFTLHNTVEITNNSQLVLSWDDTQDPMYAQSITTERTIAFPGNVPGNLSVTIPKSNGKYEGYEDFTNLSNVAPIPCNEAVESKRNTYEIGKEDGSDYVRLISRDSNQCIVLHISDILTSFGYVVETKARNIEGGAPKFYVLNKERFVLPPVYLNQGNEFASSFKILPPTFKNEQGVDVYFENISENDNSVVNDFGGIRFWHIPYEFLKVLYFEKNTPHFAEDNTSHVVDVSHPNPTKYVITLDKNTPANSSLILSQSFDNGWKAYEVKNRGVILNLFQDLLPFLFGSELKDHILINNWENGWPLDNYTLDASSYTLTIIYLPQYLQLFGFVALIGIFTYPLFKLYEKK